jgi:hypothetical protein
MHQNGPDDGPPPPHPEAPHAKTRPARAKYRGFSPEHQAMLHRADAFIADTREMLAQLEADALLQKLRASPHLRIVGGTEWSAQQAPRKGNTPKT